MRPFLWPAAFLAAATLAIVGLHSAFHHSPAPPTPHPAVVQPAKAVYVVRPGDTLAGIAAKTGVRAGRLLELNPTLTPTALFLGQRIKLR